MRPLAGRGPRASDADRTHPWRRNAQVRGYLIRIFCRELNLVPNQMVGQSSAPAEAARHPPRGASTETHEVSDALLLARTPFAFAVSFHTPQVIVRNCSKSWIGSLSSSSCSRFSCSERACSAPSSGTTMKKKRRRTRKPPGRSAGRAHATREPWAMDLLRWPHAHRADGGGDRRLLAGRGIWRGGARWRQTPCNVTRCSAPEARDASQAFDLKRLFSPSEAKTRQVTRQAFTPMNF